MNPLLPPLPKSHPTHDAPEPAEEPGRLPAVGAPMGVAEGVPSGSDPHLAHPIDPLPLTNREDAV